ncbi:MAG: hypothetical protein AAF249_08725 [Pseudomonadota bacterium]
MLITSLVFVMQAAPAVEPLAQPEAAPETVKAEPSAPPSAAGTLDTGWIAPEAQPPAPPPITLPKGHKILISVEGQVGSKISQRKDFFPIKLAEAIVVDGVEVLPAGIKGEGQVVHAAKGGFAGSAGELILAVRYLMHGDRKIPLRSFKWLEEGDEFYHRGQDASGEVLAAAAIVPVFIFARGGNTTIEPGTLATAKFRAEEIFGRDGAGAVQTPDGE